MEVTYELIQKNRRRSTEEIKYNLNVKISYINDGTVNLSLEN